MIKFVQTALLQLQNYNAIFTFGNATF